MLMRWMKVVLVGLVALAQLAFAADKLALQKVDSVVLPGDEIELRLTFDGQPAVPASYQIDKPARLVFDMPDTRNGLSAKSQSLGTGNARSLTVVETQDRTRLIVNLNELAAYNVRTEGQQLIINIGKNVVAKSGGATTPSASVAAAPVRSSAPQGKSVQNVDFRRGDQGDGQIMVELSSGSVPVDVQQQGNRIVARFMGAKIPDNLRRRLDVSDFATPVKTIDSYSEAGNAVMTIQPEGEFEYLAYQTDNKLTISVKPVSKEDKRKKADFAYSGEKLSLNFQDIEVRSVLQLIADFTSLNLVASDSVGGKITLRLQNVPWDQALDLILKTKGLDKRTIGNVMLVAPADEIAQRERLEMESNTQNEKLSPLRSEFIQVNYAKAQDLLALIGGQNRLLSERGRASVDTRTNTLIVVDTAKNIESVRDVVQRLDVPVKQVMIEARIVLATTGFSKDLGVKWGFSKFKPVNNGSEAIVLGGSRQNVNDLLTLQGNINTAAAAAASGTTGATVTRPVTFDKTTMVDLGVDKTSESSFSIGIVNRALDFIDLELSALQSEGNAEIVSTPKVLTMDKQKAKISSGQQIPYSTVSQGGTNIQFANAELSLEVTPSITPDGRINMDLLVNNDSPGDTVANGNRAINTNRVTTSVRVDDGQTVVLGGIFQSNVTKGVVKTPFLGDIPFLGRLFRRESVSNNKQELLIFVTPRLVADVLASK
ncbi:MAG TPA: type IV pilus secretin PilQ family protein [Moraxellaceae bacterium]|nr:type IV pilus secretin PilQ family protein [Moraxellaceae bacterium]